MSNVDLIWEKEKDLDNTTYEQLYIVYEPIDLEEIIVSLRR